MDAASLHGFCGQSQQVFALALSISVHTLRNWEQVKRMPARPAPTLLHIAGQHRRVPGENLASDG